MTTPQYIFGLLQINMTAMETQLPIEIPKDKITKFCQYNHIFNLSLFGSVLQQDFRSDSDIDILVEFEPGKTPGFRIVTLQQELSELRGGNKSIVFCESFPNDR